MTIPAGSAYIEATDDRGRDMLAILERISRAMDGERASAARKPGRICPECGGLTSGPPRCEVCNWHELTYVIDEVEHLIGTDSSESIARRLGYSQPRNLASVLARAGRHDLARRFYDTKERA